MKLGDIVVLDGSLGKKNKKLNGATGIVIEYPLFDELVQWCAVEFDTSVRKQKRFVISIEDLHRTGLTIPVDQLELDTVTWDKGKLGAYFDHL